MAAWTTAKKDALVQLSIKLYGTIPESGKPKKLIQLKARAAHSNFAECNTCRELRLCAPCPSPPWGTLRLWCLRTRPRRRSACRVMRHVACARAL